jgi:Raf kinase inhibitor-like YbhB/YbcL family protein
MHLTENPKEYKPLRITSTAFNANQSVPVKYTCEGKDINPPIDVDGIPEKAHSLALIVDDPDAPGKTWVHWVVWNMPVTHHIKENSVPGEQGLNDFKRIAWGGPCPPSGTHRYFFKVYALDTLLELSAKSTKKDLEQAMGEHILAYGELIGLYKKGS